MTLTLDTVKNTAIYLGDGVYFYEEDYGFWLFTSNGVAITNEIFFEPEVWAALKSIKDGC